MKRIHPEIANLDLPIASIIKAAVDSISQEAKLDLLSGIAEPDFISLRVDVYLDEIEHALYAGYDELGAKEVALTACLNGISEHPHE